MEEELTITQILTVACVSNFQSPDSDHGLVFGLGSDLGPTNPYSDQDQDSDPNAPHLL